MTTLQWSIPLPATKQPNRTPIHRSPDPLATPTLGAHGVRTLYEALRRGRDINPLGPCLGYRATASNTGYATPYVYASYGECVARVDAIAAGMEGYNSGSLLGRNEDGMLLLGIYMKNCPEWLLAEHAIYCLAGSTVPFYDTLGPDVVRFILEHTGLSCVVCSRREMERLCEAKKTGTTPNFRAVILVDGVTAESDEMAKNAGLEVVSLAKVEAVGAQIVGSGEHVHRAPDPQDVATFCYTSGTTGDPKGALITHQNIMSAVGAFNEIPILPTDRHLSYLPLPHIFERVVVAQILTAGASIAFFRGDPLLLIEDIVACRPTMLPAVPRVLNKIHDKIMAGMAAKGGLTEKMFRTALRAKTAGLQEGNLRHPLWDRILFNKIKHALGLDCLRLMVSGSAPLSPNVMTFFRCLLGVPVLEGYGQTEGSAAATISHPEDVASVGHVGGPADCVEVVLMDVPEMGYLSTDTSHHGEPCRGRGEICIRGPNVFKGYYKDDEKTKETIDEEGWLHSGDVGLWTMEGQLKIIDRKKNIFKLAQGEYVAAEKIENVLQQSPLIGQIFVHGDSFQTFLVAVIVPDEEPTRAWAKQNLSEEEATIPFPELCKNKKLKEELLSEIRRLSKQNGLQGFETVKAIHLESDIFTAEMDLVTPTFKLKRPQLRDYYAKEIEALYADPPLSKL
ncbi:hypothetical protein ACHAW6_007374 [Cyclotella cf. meneghiniana]